MEVERPVGNTTLLVGRSLNRNPAMILRELHIDERKLPIAGLDARNERVVRHGCFLAKA